MAAIRHAKVSTRNPTADSTAVQPADWNADHIIAADLDIATHKIINVVDPTLPQDAATKQYVDTHGGGGGGITNSAPNTRLMKSDGTNAVTSSITDSAGIVDINASTIVENNLTVQGTSGFADTITLSNGMVVFGQGRIAASVAAAAVAIANTETVVVSLTIPANTVVAGSTFVFDTVATNGGAGTNTMTARLRCGPTTLTGTAIITDTRTDTSQSLKQWKGTITFRTSGVSGTAVGHLIWNTPDGGGYDLTGRTYVTSPVTLNTTVTNKLEFTFISGSASTYTFSEATLAQLF